MKKFLVLVLLGAAIFFGYRYWYNPAPEVAAVPPPRLAELGTYYLLDYYSMPTEHGISAWTPGQELKAVPATDNPPGRVLVTDGHMKAELARAQLTQDMDLAAKLRANDETAQARAKKDVAATKAKIEADKRRAEMTAAHDMDLARARQRGGLPAETPAQTAR